MKKKQAKVPPSVAPAKRSLGKRTLEKGVAKLRTLAESIRDRPAQGAAQRALQKVASTCLALLEIDRQGRGEVERLGAMAGREIDKLLRDVDAQIVKKGPRSRKKPAARKRLRPGKKA